MQLQTNFVSGGKKTKFVKLLFLEIITEYNSFKVKQRRKFFLNKLFERDFITRVLMRLNYYV